MQQYRNSGLLAPRGLHLSHGQQTPLRNQTPETLRPSEELLSFSPSELGERRVTHLIHQCLVAIWPPKRASPLYGLLSRRTPKAEVSSLAVGKKYQGTSFTDLWMPPRDSWSPPHHRTRVQLRKDHKIYVCFPHTSVSVWGPRTFCYHCLPVPVATP